MVPSGFLVKGRGFPLFLGDLSWAPTGTWTSANLGSAEEDGVRPGSQPLRAHGLQLQSPPGALDSTSGLVASG